MTGLSSNRCKFDEAMLLKMGETNPYTNEVVIYDARSKINAMANKVKKGGYENTKKSYTNCTIKFCNIDNIHKVRQSYKKTVLVCNGQIDQKSFWSKIESLNWIIYVWKILQAAQSMAHTLKEEKKSAFVHCSDGWDRTA